jgi:hypothetical protein
LSTLTKEGLQNPILVSMFDGIRIQQDQWIDLERNPDTEKQGVSEKKKLITFMLEEGRIIFLAFFGQ